MLKKRIIPKFLLEAGRLVKYVHFHEECRLGGHPVSTAKIYNSYGADELIILDIRPDASSRRTILTMIEQMSAEIFMPFTVGGGVRTVDDVRELLLAGADKVSLNTAAVRTPKFVSEAAKRFGDQCITVSIDYLEVSPKEFRVMINGGCERTSLEPLEWALRAQDLHCGEILLTSIDRDGTRTGYDLDMLARLKERLEVPVIVSGGAGSLQHCMDAFTAGASAIAVSSMFLFSDHSPIKLRSYLSSNGVDVRANAGSYT